MKDEPIESQIATALESISVAEMDEFVNKVSAELITHLGPGALDKLMKDRFQHPENISAFMLSLLEGGPVVAYLTVLQIGTMIGWYARQKVEECEQLSKLENL